MIRSILKMGDGRLPRVAKPVERFHTPELTVLIEDMFDTMDVTRGTGLTAPQIGVDLQVVIFGFGRNDRYPDAPIVPKTVLINPTVEPLPDGMEEGWEGCFLVPGLCGVVPCYTRLRCTGFDQHGHATDRITEGFHTHVMQHECDHLRGVPYSMRVKGFTRFGFTEVLFPELSANHDDWLRPRERRTCGGGQARASSITETI